MTDLTHSCSSGQDETEQRRATQHDKKLKVGLKTEYLYSMKCFDCLK